MTARLFAALTALLLTACGGAATPAQNEVAPAPPAAGGLTGLYEGGAGPRRNRMCLVERGGQTRFGLIAWGQGDMSCTGFGTAVREGDVLRLGMDGDPACRIDARIEGGRVTLPERLPEGCAFYCGPQSRMAGLAFDRSGSSEADARRAVDLVGEPLCR